MRHEGLRYSWWWVMAVLIWAGVPVTEPARAQQCSVGTQGCLDGCPAKPVPRTRSVPGAGNVTLWPSSLRPVDPPGQALPSSRDSTQYNGFQLPGAPNLELFYDLDVVRSTQGTHLFMSYNAGFQIWDIGGNRAGKPAKMSQRDGWRGDFHHFQSHPTEFYFLIWDVAAIDPPNAAGSTLVSVAGESPVGLTIWDATNKRSPRQLYQDTGKTGVQVAVANIGGRSYAFFGTSGGIEVYDMTRARAVGRCFENTNTATSLCGGAADPVWRGRLGPWPHGRARYLDVLTTTAGGRTRHFVAASDGIISSNFGAEIREITDVLALPPRSESKIQGLSKLVFGVELFDYRSRHYFAAVNTNDVQVYDVTSCLNQGTGCSFSSPKVNLPTTLESAAYLQYSESNGRPFLYKGFHSLCSSPPLAGAPPKEYLLDLSGLATGDPVVDVRGGSYADPATGRRVDYWSSYYDQTQDGFSIYAPHGGRFEGEYFYRGAQSIFDVHRWTGGGATGGGGGTTGTVTIRATSPDRWLSTPGRREWVALAGTCSTGAASAWQWSAANAGAPAADPAAVVEAQQPGAGRVRGDLCAGDRYPVAVCRPRTVTASARARCGAGEAASNPLNLTLADPRPFFDGIRVEETTRPGGCQILDFEARQGNRASIGGKGLSRFEWRLVPESGDGTLSCRAGAAGEGLKCTETSLTWDTRHVDFGNTGSRRSRRKTYNVELAVANEHGELARQKRVRVDAPAAVRFRPGRQIVVQPDTPPADGKYRFVARAQGASSFRWEFEQKAGRPGDRDCRRVQPCQVRTSTRRSIRYQWPAGNENGAAYRVGVELVGCSEAGNPVRAVHTVQNVVVPGSGGGGTGGGGGGSGGGGSGGGGGGTGGGGGGGGTGGAPDVRGFELVLDGDACRCRGARCGCQVGPVAVSVDVAGACDRLAIDWGDGQRSNGLRCDAESYTHTYTRPGTYTVKAEACAGNACDTQVNLTHLDHPIPLTILRPLGRQQ